MQLSDVNHAIANRLHSAAIHLLRRLRRHDEAMGLSPARASALSVVVFGGPVTIGDLAHAEHVSPPTMTRLILGMERDGLVRRESDARDGRIVWLHPTSKGTRFLHEGRDRRVSALAEQLAMLTDRDRRTLASASEILERLLRPAARASAAERPERRAVTPPEVRPQRARRR
jgi:DNA-binding MarR family transcriptional regulator